MIIENIDYFIKFIGLNTSMIYSFFKILNYTTIKNKNKVIIMFFNIILCVLQVILLNILPSPISRLFIIYSLYCMLLSYMTKNKLGYSIVITSISFSISYIIMMIVSFLLLCITMFCTNIYYKNPIIMFIIFILTILFTYSFFKINRFKNGFTFLQNKNKNEHLDIFTLIITTIIIFIHLLLMMHENMSLQFLTVSLALFSLIMIFILQRTFILFQKAKLLNKTVKDYEIKISELQEKLDTALQEKHKLTKTHHEFYHRQEALKQKLENLAKLNTADFSTEFAEEYSTILDRINNLSNEYSNNVKILPKLPKTNIAELDDMFTYMQSECNKSNIEFILKLNDYTDYMVENLIPLNRLETLIGDLLRNAIIAINHSENSFRNIMCTIGKNSKFYELSIYDSGIDFNIETLLKLGLETATTHSEEGGTGIGFLTTFETLNSTNASIIIKEFANSEKSYTKCITIRFDNKNEYIINSYRYNEIEAENFKLHNRNIVIVPN